MTPGLTLKYYNRTEYFRPPATRTIGLTARTSDLQCHIHQTHSYPESLRRTHDAHRCQQNHSPLISSFPRRAAYRRPIFLVWRKFHLIRHKISPPPSSRSKRLRRGILRSQRWIPGLSTVSLPSTIHLSRRGYIYTVAPRRLRRFPASPSSTSAPLESSLKMAHGDSCRPPALVLRHPSEFRRRDHGEASGFRYLSGYQNPSASAISACAAIIKQPP